MRQLIAPILFLLSSGIFFNVQGRRNIPIIALAGVLAIVGVFFTVEQLIERIVAHVQGTRDGTSEIVAATILALGSILAAAVGAFLGNFLERPSSAADFPQPTSARTSGPWDNAPRPTRAVPTETMPGVLPAFMVRRDYLKMPGGPYRYPELERVGYYDTPGGFYWYYKLCAGAEEKFLLILGPTCMIIAAGVAYYAHTSLLPEQGIYVALAIWVLVCFPLFAFGLLALFRSVGELLEWYQAYRSRRS